MKFNLGCGRRVYDGYVNVDIQAHPRASRPPEFVGVDVRNIDAACADGAAEEIMLIHVIEHLYHWEVAPALGHWFKKLRPGGLLVLEAPDAVKCAQNLLAGMPDQEAMWGFYGDPRLEDPYMCHRWAWTPATLAPLLGAVGFVGVASEPPEHHGRRLGRDFRLVGRKPA